MGKQKPAPAVSVRPFIQVLLYYWTTLLLFLLRHATTLPLSSSHQSPHLGYSKNERLSNQNYPWYAYTHIFLSVSILDIGLGSLIDSIVIDTLKVLPFCLSNLKFSTEHPVTYPSKEDVWLSSLSVIVWSGNHNATGWTVDVMDRLSSLPTVLKCMKHEICGVHTPIQGRPNPMIYSEGGEIYKKNEETQTNL